MYYNRLAHKIAIANLGGPVKRKIQWKESKENMLSYNNSYFCHSFILITITSKEKWKRNIGGKWKAYNFIQKLLNF